MNGLLLKVLVVVSQACGCMMIDWALEKIINKTVNGGLNKKLAKGKGSATGLAMKEHRLCYIV